MLGGGYDSLLIHKRDRSNYKRTLLTVRQVYNITNTKSPLELNLGLRMPSCESPIEQRHRLTSEDGEFIEDVSQFSSIVWSNLYITRPDIAYVVGVVSQVNSFIRQKRWSRCRIQNQNHISIELFFSHLPVPFR